MLRAGSTRARLDSWWDYPKVVRDEGLPCHLGSRVSGRTHSQSPYRRHRRRSRSRTRRTSGSRLGNPPSHRTRPPTLNRSQSPARDRHLEEKAPAQTGTIAQIPVSMLSRLVVLLMTSGRSTPYEM